MPIEVDFAQGTMSDCSVVLGDQRLLPSGTMRRFSYEADRLAQFGLCKPRKLGMRYVMILVQPDDLPPRGASPTSAQRYWYPVNMSPQDGWSVMLTVPKIIISFERDASVGSPMVVRWFFWTNVLRMNQRFNDPWETYYWAATDVAVFVEPIPPTRWVVPRLRPLPATLPEQPMSRMSILTARA